MAFSVRTILLSAFLLGASLQAAGIGPHLLRNGVKPKPQTVPGRLVRSELYNPALIPIPGAIQSVAADINDRGEVVGHYTVPQGEGMSREVTFVWNGKTLQSFSHPDFPDTALVSISNSGVLFGSWGNDSQVLAGFHDPKRNVWRALPPYLGLPLNFGTDATEAGVAIGYSCSHAFHCVSWLWNGKVYEALSVPTAPLAVPTSINNRGQIVGFAGAPPAVFSGFLLDRGVLTWIAPAGITATEIIPRSISNSGQIVLHGETNPIEFWKPFLLDRGTLKELPEYGEPGQTTYNVMNSRGDLAGVFYSLAEDRLYAIVATRKQN